MDTNYINIDDIKDATNKYVFFNDGSRYRIKENDTIKIEKIIESYKVTMAIFEKCIKEILNTINEHKYQEEIARQNYETAKADPSKPYFTVDYCREQIRKIHSETDGMYIVEVHLTKIYQDYYMMYNKFRKIRRCMR